MSGYFGHGRLQDAEWLMRACMLLNRDIPPHAPDITPETVLNKSYTQQAAEFESLLERIDPEGDIDRTLFPAVAYFNAAESLPLDIILAAIAALLIWMFMPNYYSIMEYVAYMAVAAYLAIQFLRARSARERAARQMRRMGLNPQERHPLTLRQLVKYRQRHVTIH